MLKRGPKIGVSSQIIDWLELIHDLARAKLRGGSWRACSFITRKWYFHYEFLLVSLRVILSPNGSDWSELALAILPNIDESRNIPTVTLPFPLTVSK